MLKENCGQLIQYCMNCSSEFDALFHLDYNQARKQKVRIGIPDEKHTVKLGGPAFGAIVCTVT